MTSDTPAPRLAKLPFLAADALLLAAGATIVLLSARPLGVWTAAVVAGCVALGAWVCILPFLREHEAAVKLTETDRLRDTAARIGQLETIATRISQANNQWQVIQDKAAHTAETARGIADRLTQESRAFAETLHRASDQEKQHLRLEVEKLRRSEGDWLQVLARILDHTWGLHIAAMRYGQANVVEQVGAFQNACRDAARRVGLVPFIATPDEPFDTSRHQLAPDSPATEGDGRVAETIATGYLYQGRLIRPALVRVRPAAAETASLPGAAEPSEPSAPAETAFAESSPPPEPDPAAADPSAADQPQLL